MKELVIIIKPEKLETVKMILDENKCGGMSISSVMGCGTQKGVSQGYNSFDGHHATINLLPKIKIEAVVTDELVEPIMVEICEKVSTGTVGDGKIFVRNIEESVRIRTGSRGDEAL